MERETYPYVLIIFVRDGICSHEVTELIIQNNNSPVFRRSHNIKVGQEIFDRVQFFLKGGMTNIFQDSFHIERLLYLLSCDAEEKIVENSPLEKIITHIHENFTRTITVDELAELIAVSPSHLSHIFKKQTDYAPVEYVLKMRMERAMMLLTHSSKTVAEISEEVGYEAVQSFIKIFKKKTNFSPSVYRKMQKSC